MFDDPCLIGSWPTLTAYLDAAGVVRRWAASEPELVTRGDVDTLLAAWADPDSTHQVGAALVRLAAADGGCDDDALLLLLHLLSGVVWRLTAQLGDLSPDVTAIVLSELTCQIRSYRWRIRSRGLVTSLEKDTRRAVLAELRPSDRYHPERVEQLTWDGDVTALRTRPSLICAADGADEDLDVADLLRWAAAAGVNSDDLSLLVDSERARGRRGAHADAAVAAARGIDRRTLLRHRQRTLAALRELAPAYLAAVA
jgi:hypothetical protein